MVRKCQNELKPNGMMWKTNKIIISINFYTENLMFPKRYESTEVDGRTWATCVIGDSLVHQQWHQVVEI